MDIRELNEKYDVARIPRGVYVGTPLGKFEREMAAALLIELWKRKGEITPVTLKEIAEMIEDDQKAYREFEESVKQRYEEEIKKMGKFSKAVYRLRMKFATRVTFEMLSSNGEYIKEESVKLPKRYAEKYAKIKKQVELEKQLPWNPLLEAGFRLFRTTVLYEFREMQKDGLVEIRNEDNALIPTARLLEPIFSQYSQYSY